MLYATPDELLTREQLHDIAIPERGVRSAQWQGINHGDLADAIIARSEKMGLKVLNEVWKTNPMQTDLFGSIDLDTTDFIVPDLGQEGVFSLGVRHSNIGRYAITFAVGARVAVCENGMLTGEFCLSRKHTSRVDLEAVIDKGLERYLADAQLINLFASDLREKEITDGEAALYIVEAGRRNIMPWTKLGEVDQQWNSPEFTEFEDRNAWSLYNGFTRVIQQLSGPNQMRCLKEVRELFQ